ncbi:hypothetical protein VNO78_00685 [Psophocarpus tetragonolobus]|uniref:Uncharacterized protein n=1 Tax=Psophocarpus tetragonolobus TaxID=3891 RepID=A0AAN9SXC6_PSOTE
MESMGMAQEEAESAHFVCGGVIEKHLKTVVDMRKYEANRTLERIGSSTGVQKEREWALGNSSKVEVAEYRRGRGDLGGKVVEGEDEFVEVTEYRQGRGDLGWKVVKGEDEFAEVDIARREG